ncbi:FKBP-type peptidyl-prolyl cis-trans isomerase domain-containing protein [Tanacetum coccineum]
MFLSCFIKSCENYEATEKKTLLSSYGEATVSFTKNGREPASANKFVAPPNATIQITRELFSKKVFNEGEGYDRQNDGAIVQVKLIGKLYDGTVFVNIGDNEVPFEFEIDVVDWLDRGVKTMKKGEVASLTIHPEYAFGSTELHQESVTVPANSNVYYAVDLVSFEKIKMMFKYCKRKNSRKVVITLLPILEFPYPTIIDCYGALHILNGSSTELFTIVIGTKDETKFSVGDVKLFKLNMNNKVWGEMDDLKETIISVELSTDSTPLFATHAIVSSESGGIYIFLATKETSYTRTMSRMKPSLSFLHCVTGTNQVFELVDDDGG